ncbi:MAG: hypothetical protein ACI90V_011061, partial [Bacillariaceae sp.]
VLIGIHSFSFLKASSKNVLVLVVIFAKTLAPGLVSLFVGHIVVSCFTIHHLDGWWCLDSLGKFDCPHCIFPS